MRLSTYTIRAPQGWRLDHSFGSHAVFADDGGDQIEFSELSFPSGVSLDRMARISLRGSVWSRKPRIRPHVTIGSTAFYHLAGSTGGGEYVEEYGAPRHGRRMKVTFDLYSGRRAALRTIGSVMATFRVR